jgi:predicted ester cyclase
MDAAEVYRAYNRAENAHDWNATTALLSSDIHVMVNGASEVSSAEEDRRAMEQLVALFPDYRREVLSIVPNGDEAAIRWKMTGSSIDDPSVDLSVEGASFIVVSGGRIREAFLFAQSGELARALEMAHPGRRT